MTTIRLQFPAGRYHATPHGRHVNEGVAEWPPSPYRLLRALYDVWQRKCSHVSQDVVESVLGALAAAPPQFHLPRATATHTRSYLNANSMDPSDKNLVFDPFLAFDPGVSCYMSWPGLQLSPAQESALEQLLFNLNYLGRSESWIHAALCTDAPLGVLCTPLEISEGVGEPVPVACAAGRSEYTGKRPWLDALTASTAEVAKQRASAPPLLKQVRYLRPANSIETNPVATPSPVALHVQAVLLILDGAVLPLVTQTVEVAEQIRSRLMGAHKRVMGNGQLVSPLFSGKDAAGAKRLDHGHIYILPLSEDSIRINRVLLAGGRQRWTPEELRAAYGVRKLFLSEDRPDVRCAVSWHGGTGALQQVWTRTKVVESATPFVPPRHWRKGRDFSAFLEDEVRRECRNHGHPEPVRVTPLDRIRDGHFECVEYRRARRGDPVRPGFSLQLCFDTPVLAPFSLGYAAHFGLGLFLPSGSR